MNVASFVQFGAAVQMRLNRRLRLSRQAPVFSRATRPGQVPEKLLASSSGLSLPTTPSQVCGAVGPVNEDADHADRRSAPAW